MRKMRRQNSAISDQLVVTIVLDTGATERKCIHLYRGDSLFLRILHFTDQLKPQNCPQPIKLCDKTLRCDHLRLYGNNTLCDRLRSAIRDRLRSSAIIWKPALTQLSPQTIKRRSRKGVYE